MLKRTAALAFLLLTTGALFGEDALRVRVTKILDGDTIVVRDPVGRETIVWIDGIAAPEGYQAYAGRARYELRNIVSMRTVLVIPRFYAGGGIVGKVLLGDLDVGLEQLRRGMAWYDDSADLDREEERSAYEDAEQKAREERLGLWRAEHPVPPWEYRRLRR